MADLSIKLACRRSERTAAILDGAVKPRGIDVRAVEMSDGQKLFSGMLNGEYDAAEFSLAELVHNIARNRKEILAIPVFPTRAFRHGFIFYNPRSGIEGPEDLNGKRIGFRQWVETASVWIRGILVDEYRVSPAATRWYAVTMHHWNTNEEEATKSSTGFTVNWLERVGKNPVQSAEAALVDGRIDALGMVPAPPGFALGDQRMQRLFDAYRDVEVGYFKKTRIFPIMHVLVARSSLVERYPRLPEMLFELFVDSKRNERRTPPGSALVWQDYYSAEEKQLFNGDPWTYGLDPNLHVLDTFLRYCHSQGISDRQLVAKELFYEGTWRLAE